jgi:hypothetical protein
MHIGRKPLTLSLILVASLLLSPSAALAQNGAAPSRDWSAVKAVAPGTKLSVKLAGGKSVEGRLDTVSDATLSLTVGGKPRELRRDDVLRVEQVGGTSAGKMTLIGAGVGAGVGAGIGAATSDEDDFIFTRGQAAAVVGAIGAGVGALAGFAIGKARRKRVLIYEAARP